MRFSLSGPAAGLVLTRKSRTAAPARALPLVLSLLLTAALVLSGCAGGGGYTSPEPDPAVSHASPPPPPPGANDPNRPAGNPGGTIAPDVEIFTSSDRMIITDFRVDFAKMRNVLGLVGFYPDRWDQMEPIPFARIRELQFRGGIDTDTFERITKGREDYQLNQGEIFRVTIGEMDGGSLEYIAIIPRLRGFRDGQTWSLSMNGGAGIDRIVFRQKR